MSAKVVKTNKINVACRESGQQKVFEVPDEHALTPFIEKRMGAEVAADTLGPEWKGYVLRITGGHDKEGVPMMQGVLKNGRVRLLFKDGMKCYRERRAGMRKRKSVRGCIVGHDIKMLCVTIAQKGEAEIPGLTDGTSVRRLGPKRASRIRKMFDLTKDDDVRKYVNHRVVKEGENAKTSNSKAPKIQRLVTARRIQRKRRVRKTTVKKVQENREAKAEYTKKVAQYRHDKKEARHAEVARKKKSGAKKKSA